MRSRAAWPRTPSRRVDADEAVLLDVDLDVELLLEAADRLAALADQEADLVRLDLDRQHLRRVLGELGARLGEGLGHLAEDVQPCVLGLAERAAQQVGRDARDLDVHLQGRDAVGGAGDLEVHVAEVILGALDVREDDQVVALLDQAHRDARDRCLDRHAGVHQRRASSRRPRPSTSEPFDSRISETTRIVYGNSSRRPGSTGSERALGERAVADVTALRAAHEARLADRERREVVVVDVALRRVERQVVDALLLLGRAERRERQRLRLPAGEERRAVRARRDATTSHVIGRISSAVRPSGRRFSTAIF